MDHMLGGLFTAEPPEKAIFTLGVADQYDQCSASKHLVSWTEVKCSSSILVWRIPGTEEPGGLPSVMSHRVGHD